MAQIYQTFIATKQIKQRLPNIQTRAFLSRKAIEYRDKETPVISINDAPPIKQDLEAIMFWGTDNRLTVMTETVGMNLNKYKYHLSLHSRFSPLVTLGATVSAAANEGKYHTCNCAVDFKIIKCFGTPSG